VPQRLAPVLRALGARVIHTSRSGNAVGDNGWRSLDALLAEADVVSLHVPLTPETQGIMNAERLARMRHGAILVNTARGGLVDEGALLAALRSGALRAAGLDVFVQESAGASNPLLALDNVVATPHVAWLTPETLERSLGIALENCRRLAAGDTLLHRVV
jgi:phosphoglycerate dehydrogenase-like enzyme